MEEEEESTVCALITDLEETLNTQKQSHPLPFTLPTLQNLQSLLDSNDPQILSQLLSNLSSKSFSLSSLLPPTHLRHGLSPYASFPPILKNLPISYSFP